MSAGSIAAPHAASIGRLRGALSPRRRWIWYLLIPALAVALRFCEFGRGIPYPIAHDEFSYLLAADTFASGRLANPTPAHWEFFETFHVNMTPRYVSKYPPAQGIALALGQVLFGHPWYGALLGMLAMFAALAWCLYGWLPPRAALFTGAIAVISFFDSYWMNGYWGAAIAACGGCLIIGAIPRLWRRPSAGTAFALAAGLIILANSRPFEGCALALGGFTALAIGLRRRPGSAKRLLQPAVLGTFCLVLALGGAWMLLYNRATTGSAFRLAYQVNRDEYGSSPQFWVASPTPVKTYRHEALRRFWIDEQRAFYLQVRHDPLRQKGLQFLGAAIVLAPGPAVLFLALGALIIFRRRKSGASKTAPHPPVLRHWVLIIPIAAVAAAVFVNAGSLPHYFSPAFAAFFVIEGLGVQRLLTMGRRRPLIWAFPAILLIAMVRLTLQLDYTIAEKYPSPGKSRAALSDSLLRQGPEHLVFIAYSPDHEPGAEWVYNAADIDRSAVIWARDMGADKDAVLRRSYPGRKAWLATVSGTELRGLSALDKNPMQAKTPAPRQLAVQ